MAHSEVVRDLVKAWQSATSLVELAATGVLAKVENNKVMNRKEVCQNVQALIPVVQHLGT